MKKDQLNLMLFSIDPNMMTPLSWYKLPDKLLHGCNYSIYT